MTYLNRWSYPEAGKRAFELADLLLKREVAVTVNNKSVNSAKEEFRANIKQAVECNLSGL